VQALRRLQQSSLTSFPHTSFPYTNVKELLHRPDDSASQSCLSMQAVLQPEELELLLASKHRPNYVLQILSGLVESSCIVSPERFRMDQNITFFMDAQGSCERILKTPIPLSYTRWAVVLLVLVLVLVLLLVHVLVLILVLVLVLVIVIVISGIVY